jgi:hypothetical protein
MGERNTTRTEIIPASQAGSDITPYSYYSANFLSSKEVKKIGSEYERHQLSIQAEKAKAKEGMEAVAAIRETAVAVFTFASIRMDQYSQHAPTKELQTEVATFSKIQENALADNLMAIAQLAAQNIGQNVARPVYEKPDEPKRWWQK